MAQELCGCDRWFIKKSIWKGFANMPSKVGFPLKPSNCAAFLIIAVSLTGCSSLKLASSWHEESLPIDGKGTDWRDTLTVLNDKTTALGVLNDCDYLFVRLLTTNRTLERQIIRQGLTFWFDPNGGDKQTFGVRFPLGLGSPGRYRRAPEGRPASAGFMRGDSIFVPVNDLEILGPDKGEVHRMSFAEATGIDARFQTAHDTLTYTLKVPISGSGYFPFTVGATPGSMVGVTMETTNAPPPNRESAEGSGEDGGRWGGGGYGGYGGFGGRRGYGGGGFGGGRFNRGAQEKPFTEFFKIQLADSVSSVPR